MEKVVAGAGLTLAASGIGLGLGGIVPDAAAVLLTVPLIASVPAWMSRRAAERAAIRWRRAADRERDLAGVSVDLAAAGDVAAVHRLAVDAAIVLLAGRPGAHAALVAPDPDEPGVCQVTAYAGEGGATYASRRMPAGVLARMIGGEPDPDFPMRALPLAADAALLVGVTGDLPPAFETLRAEVSLALAAVTSAAELDHRALYDPLTGLGSRALMRERLEAALARARRSGRPVGVLLLDLNGFKQVNDAHGNDAGDRLLQVAADRLRLSVRAEDVVGRLGGDEFVVVAEDLHSARDALMIAERIVRAMDEPVEAGRARLRTPASVGVVLSHSETSGADEMLRLADAAMYTAKRRGGGHHLHGAPDPATVAS